MGDQKGLPESRARAYCSLNPKMHFVLAPNPLNLGCWSLKSGLREGQRLAYARTAPRNTDCAHSTRYQLRRRSCFWVDFK